VHSQDITEFLNRNNRNKLALNDFHSFKYKKVDFVTNNDNELKLARKLIISSIPHTHYIIEKALQELDC